MSKQANKCLILGISAITFLIVGALTVTKAQAKDLDSKNPEETASLGEIVVTAEKRSERIKDLPIAISAYTSDMLESAGVEGLRGLQLQTPSLQIGTTGAETYLTIRGVGTEIVSIGAEPAIAVSQDGVVLASHLLFDTDFLDVARVEVMRGPQGTISGRNSTGGAINIISARPTSFFDASLGATAGNYNRYSTQGHVSGPIAGDQVMGRLAFSTDRAAGWLHDTAQNQWLGSRDKVHARGSILADVTSNFEALIQVEKLVDNSQPQRSANIGRARLDVPSLGEKFGVQDLNMDNLTFQTNQRRDYKRDQTGVATKLKWEMAPKTTLTYTAGYWKSDISEIADTDGTLVSIGEFPKFNYNLSQVSQEATLATDISQRVDLILGGLYLRADAKQPLEFVANVLGIAPGLYVANPDQRLESHAVYTQLRYKPVDNLRVSAGIRYTKDKKTYFEDGFIFAPVSGGGEHSWTALTPRFSIDYHPTTDLTLFGNIARGFKAGGFNTLNVNPVNVFNPEYVWSYEVGAKASIAKSVQGAITAFHMDYKDLQQIVFSNVGGMVTSAVQNAAKATIDGFELELDTKVTKNLRLGMSSSWLRSRFDELSSIDPVYPELGVRNLAGNQLARSPRWQMSAYGEYTQPMSNGQVVILRADYSWRDHQFFDFYNHRLIAQDAYGLLNISAGLESADGKWRISAYGRNVLNKRYLTNALGTVILPGVPMKLGVVGDPRTVGVNVLYKF